MTFSIEAYRNAALEYQRVHDERTQNFPYLAYKQATIDYCKTLQRPKVQIAASDGNPATKLDAIMRKIALRTGFIVECIDVEYLTMRTAEQLVLQFSYGVMKADELFTRYREAKSRLKQLAQERYDLEKQKNLYFDESPAASQKYRLWSGSFALLEK